MACGGKAPNATAPEAGSEQVAPEAAAPVPSPPVRVLPWWQGVPACDTGELKRRTLTWGGVYWCAVTGTKVDKSLQSDLSRLARCVHESVSAFQEEPAEGKLGEFLARAHESGLNAILCSAVRRDAEVRTYHGRRVLMKRSVASEGETELEVLYRFSCEGCTVAAETKAKVARH